MLLYSVFKAKRAEMTWAIKHSGPRDEANEVEAVVRLRGLPYGCSKEEIANFFSGSFSFCSFWKRQKSVGGIMFL
jgi:hypothetical protein